MVPPLALNVAELPTQIVALFTLGTIAPPIVRVTVPIPIQPAAEVPVIVYVVVTVGLAVTLAPVAELKVAEGDHVYVDAPPAVNMVDAPGHIVAEATVTVGKGFTVTDVVAVFMQPTALVPVTV